MFCLCEEQDEKRVQDDCGGQHWVGAMTYADRIEVMALPRARIFHPDSFVIQLYVRSDAHSYPVGRRSKIKYRHLSFDSKAVPMIYISKCPL